ncbi:MAG: hypothetical protein KIT81_07120 [Alphaproteobacteria bacterium]|nr:hypothetical protein [Alphaproteobacteria bacterium]
MSDMSRRADDIHLPPGYVLRRVRHRPFAAASKAAAAGAEDGSLFWHPREDFFDAALLLRPLDEEPRALTLAYVLLLGLIDGLASVVPPETPARLVWPDRLLVNEGCVGGLRLSRGPLVARAGRNDVPDWLVFGVAIRMRAAAPDDAPGRDLEYTDLHEEGCGMVAVSQLLETFARHLLRWIECWQEDGPAPVLRACEMRFGAGEVRLGERGDAWIGDGARRRRRLLAPALAAPSWRLAGLDG